MLDHIINLTYRVSLVKRVCGGGVCVLPLCLIHKRAVLNLDSPNGECFQYAFVASIHHTEVDQHHKNHASLYKKYMKLYDFTCFTYPIDAAEIKHFEKLNPNVSINAVIWDDDDGPQLCYASHNHTAPNHSMLLFYNNHWLPVADFNQLMGCENVSSAYCSYCLNNFHHPENLTMHIPKCLGQQEFMPVNETFE